MQDKTLSLNAEEFDARITELFGADNASKVRALLESGSQNKELQVEIDVWDIPTTFMSKY